MFLRLSMYLKMSIYLLSTVKLPDEKAQLNRLKKFQTEVPEKLENAWTRCKKVGIIDSHPGIYRDKTMVNKLMYIRFSGLQLVVETLGHLINQLTKSIKVSKNRLRKLYYEILGTSVINSPLSPSS